MAYALSEDVVHAIDAWFGNKGGVAGVKKEMDKVAAASSWFGGSSSSEPAAVVAQEKKAARPFPYREDVATGLYIYGAAKEGLTKVTPLQRKDHMPLNFREYCQQKR